LARLIERFAAASAGVAAFARLIFAAARDAVGSEEPIAAGGWRV